MEKHLVSMTMTNWSIPFTEMIGFYPENLSKHTTLQQVAKGIDHCSGEEYRCTPILTRVWQELEYRIDVCRVTRGAHIEHL
jgi:hypothetical protein